MLEDVAPGKGCPAFEHRRARLEGDEKDSDAREKWPSWNVDCRAKLKVIPTGKHRALTLRAAGWDPDPGAPLWRGVGKHGAMWGGGSLNPSD
ncbi:NACHT, LRR and PYD domains-containing protein 1-like protein [Anopheles sinensis]|uniref:NACHT, LRR and PYD domains-containing protein 1-like protein n=1 Tax=Anopheles sinensis TaxID=74873 RepID=A0A084VSH1_ANOSI|nr:NACHT, LRR and PYD domains-containing protein 1-like protein [Anopheles sinensis]